MTGVGSVDNQVTMLTSLVTSGGWVWMMGNTTNNRSRGRSAMLNSEGNLIQFQQRSHFYDTH